MGKGLLHLGLVVGLVAGSSLGCGSSEVSDESSRSAQTNTSMSTTTALDSVAADDCDELSTLVVAAYQEVFDLMEGYTLEEVEHEPDSLMRPEDGEALEERFSDLERRERELECASTAERATVVLLCPSVSQFRVVGEAAEDFHSQLVAACAVPEPRDLAVVSADVWSEQVCTILDPFWVTVDDAWAIMTPETGEPLDGADLVGVTDTWMVELTEVAERSVDELTAAGAPDVDDGSIMATAQIVAFEEVAAAARAGHEALPDADEPDPDLAMVTEAMHAAASSLGAFDAHWGELFEELMSDCEVEATFTPRGGPDVP